MTLARVDGGADRPALLLLRPELIPQPARRQLDVGELYDLVLGDVPKEDAVVRHRYGEGVGRASCRAILDQTVAAESADAIEALARFQGLLCNRHDFARRSGKRGDGRIAVDHRAGDR